MRSFSRGLFASLCLGLPFLLAAADSATRPGRIQEPPKPAPAATPAPQAPEKLVAPAHAAAKFDVNDCKTCHEPVFASFEHTRHMKVEGSCEACHGDVTNHLQSEMERGEVGTIRSFKRMKSDEISSVCLSCHEQGRQADWKGSVHDRRDLACTSCHGVHNFRSMKAQLKTARDSETCFSCHPQIRAKGMRNSHHPVREGKMDCASCHNPHDSTRPKMIRAEWNNELCLSCHTEKRGPFLWEHAPVRENCLNCHDPHGSNHDKLLVAKQPYLCQRCHLNTRHPGTLYDFRNTIAGTNPSNRAVEHACRNCHQNVHGTNHPSGPYLGR